MYRGFSLNNTLSDEMKWNNGVGMNDPVTTNVQVEQSERKAVRLVRSLQQQQKC